jgi:hypothetical protein
VCVSKKYFLEEITMGLDGQWYNELGSQMTLQIDGAQITGIYTTNVGATGTYTLVGALDLTPTPASQTFGFVVAWQQANSVTTWSGQYQLINGQETLTMLWLLTSETAPPNNWRATTVGEDLFTRTPPQEETKATKLARGSFSHPFL